MVIVWGREGCFLCGRMKERLREAGISFESRDLDPILRGDCDTTDSKLVGLVHAYVFAGSRMPIVQVNGLFLSYPKAVAWLREKMG